MHIAQIKAENFMRLTVVDCTFEDGIVKITGKNRHGKTSLLRMIQALSGKKELPDIPINDDARKGNFEMMLMEDGELKYTVGYNFTNKGHYLKLENADGEPQSNTERLTGGNLGRRLGFLGFDPLLALKEGLGWLGFARLELLALYIVVGGILSLVLDDRSFMPLAVGLLAAFLALFFVSYYGAAMEVVRHVYPTLVVFDVGGALYVFSLADIAVQRIRSVREKR